MRLGHKALIAIIAGGAITFASLNSIPEISGAYQGRVTSEDAGVNIEGKVGVYCGRSDLSGAQCKSYPSEWTVDYPRGAERIEFWQGDKALALITHDVSGWHNQTYGDMGDWYRSYNLSVGNVMGISSKYLVKTFDKNGKLISDGEAEGFGNGYEVQKESMDNALASVNLARFGLVVLAGGLVMAVGAALGLGKRKAVEASEKIEQTLQVCREKNHQARIASIAEEEAVRSAARAKVESSSAAKQAIQAQIVKAMEAGQTKTAKALMDALAEMDD